MSCQLQFRTHLTLTLAQGFFYAQCDTMTLVQIGARFSLVVTLSKAEGLRRCFAEFILSYAKGSA